MCGDALQGGILDIESLRERDNQRISRYLTVNGLVKCQGQIVVGGFSLFVFFFIGILLWGCKL